MNRHARRAAQSTGWRTKDQEAKVVAVHEAGHAVAQVLSIGEMGYGFKEAVVCIDIGGNLEVAQGMDTEATVMSQGTTYGHTFSNEIHAASLEFLQNSVSRGRDPAERMQIIELGRAAGADIGKWFRARVLRAVSGPIAEAIFSNESFHKVWTNLAATADLAGIIEDANLSNIEQKEIESTIDRMAALSAHLMELPPVWAAILALAKKLPIRGRLEGDDCWAIIASCLPESELTSIFANGVSSVAKLENEIRSAGLVVAIDRGGSKKVIRGREIVRGSADEGGPVVYAELKVRFPVYGETLWRAFGDGRTDPDPIAKAS